MNTITDQLGVRILGKKLVNRGAEACRLVDKRLELGVAGTRQYIRCAHAREKRLCIQANHLGDLAQRSFRSCAKSGKLRVKCSNPLRRQSKTVVACRELGAGSL